MMANNEMKYEVEPLIQSKEKLPSSAQGTFDGIHLHSFMKYYIIRIGNYMQLLIPEKCISHYKKNHKFDVR